MGIPVYPFVLPPEPGADGGRPGLLTRGRARAHPAERQDAEDQHRRNNRFKTLRQTTSVNAMLTGIATGKKPRSRTRGRVLTNASSEL